MIRHFATEMLKDASLLRMKEEAEANADACADQVLTESMARYSKSQTITYIFSHLHEYSICM